MASQIQNTQPKAQASIILKKLLGSLETQVMEFMWQTGEATVQEVTDALNRKRRIAYTTVMTVMVHLVDKGLLARTKEGKRYRYMVARDKQEFLRDSSNSRLQDLISDFGDIAIAQFLEQIEQIDDDRLQRLRDLVQEASDERDTSE